MGFLKKYATYLVLLAVLVAVSVLLLTSRGKGTYRKADRDFAVRDTSAVNTVEISRESDTLILAREGSSWRVNGIYAARAERMKGLMILLSRLEVRAPAPKSGRERIAASLAAKGKNVHILLDGGTGKSYRIYYDSTDDASYMQMARSEIPFAMDVRGYRERNLDELYVLDARYWRDNTILDFLPEQIKRVSLENMREPSSSFHLDRDESGSFMLARRILPGSWTVPDRERLAQYLHYFSNVRFESFTGMQQLSREGKSVGEEPEFILTLVSTDMHRVRIEIFTLYSDDGEGGRVEDLNRVVARAGKMNESVILKYVEIDPLLKPYSYFLGD